MFKIIKEVRDINRFREILTVLFEEGFDFLIEKIRLKHYDVIVVYSMDRFSREHPRKTDELLNRIVYDYKCRFISLAEAIDSNDEMKWHIVRHMFTYFANMFSRNLSMKVKNGIKNKKELRT